MEIQEEAIERPRERSESIEEDYRKMLKELNEIGKLQKKLKNLKLIIRRKVDLDKSYGKNKK